jgi:hypothetical protein
MIVCVRVRVMSETNPSAIEKSAPHQQETQVRRARCGREVRETASCDVDVEYVGSCVTTS